MKFHTLLRLALDEKDLFNIWMLWYSTNIFSSLILFSGDSVSRQAATINLNEISHTSEKTCSTFECYDIKQIFSIHWYSLVVKVFPWEVARINLYEISHTYEKICSTSECYDIQQIIPVHRYSLVVKVFPWEVARINLYEISHTSEKICSTSECYVIQQIFSVHRYSLVVKVFPWEVARINLYGISHTSEKIMFNIWMLWYSTNIFSSPLLIGSESVSMRSCQNKFV